ncbi:pggt1b [Trichonephila clavipes]|uniref:Pggt1b n=1 Tax=Trichonephila clavipes TaxID=2585209 RepID=A0A8X6WBG6_TRICX|nr:pggt1b [Trichonephila clavipes]
MRQARHLPQRWYWSIVLQVRDVIRQFTQGTPNCNTNPKATVFGIPKEPVLESAELITSRLTGAGSLLPPVYGEAWAKGHATGTPDSTFPGTGRRTRQTCGACRFQRVFAYHRSQYSRYSAIYTDGSKRADYVGCGVVIEDIMHGYRLDTSCSIFTAEAVAIYRALQLIDSTMPRKYCIYTDSMSVLEALENYHDRCHPVVCTILDITSRLYSKGFDIVFCWLPSHVGIIGNEQADSAAKSATTHLPLVVPLSDMKRVILHHIFKIWQESWSQQLDNKLHSVKPVIEHGL